MKWDNYFRSLETIYRIEINKNLRKIIEEHFGDNLNIYSGIASRQEILSKFFNGKLDF